MQLFLGVGLFLVLNAHGQHKVFQFKYLTMDDGLSSSNVRCVLQDYKGFMWFGTTNGLNRYDGVTISIYKNISSDSGSLPENMVRAIFEDHDKKLFIGTGGGLSQYDRDLDCFVNYRYKKSSPMYNLVFTVHRIAEDSVGNLWLATNIGLIFFDRKSNTIKQHLHDPQNPFSICDNYLNEVFIDKTGRLWIGTTKGLDLFIPAKGVFEHIIHCKTHADTIMDISFLDIVQDKAETMWFGSTDGIFRLGTQDESEKIELSHYLKDSRDPNSISHDRIRSLFVTHDGILLVGTENGGINAYNRDNDNFSYYRIDDFAPMCLNNESIHAMIEDRSRNLWVCTWGGGVNIASNTSGFINHYKNVPGAPNSLSYNIVSGFVVDRFNRTWVGTDGGGFNLFDQASGRFTRYTTANTAIKSDALNCIVLGTNDIIWMGTWEGGLIRFNYRDNSVTSLTTQNSEIPDNTFYSIAQDSTGNLWLGSFRHGLVYYQIEKNTFATYAPRQIDTGSTQISVVRVDRKGRVFLGTNNNAAIFVFIPSENRFIDYSIMPDTMSRDNNPVSDILIENDTCTWVATQKGLYRFNPDNGNHTWYLREGEAGETPVKGLALDKTGMLWATTNVGLFRFDCRRNAFKHFTISDGLQGNDFYRASIFAAKSGAIFAGGANGFNVISPERYVENRSVPEIAITDLLIFNEKVKVGARGSPLEKEISETKKLTLSYKQSFFTFCFAALDFTNPDKNKYAYRMENFDKDWIFCGNRKDATYTSLNPGRYYFHVKGSNDDGIWNETGTTLELIITPPWWETNAARIGFVCLVLSLLFGVYYYFRNKQEEKHRREVLASRKKTDDIMQSIDEAIFTINQDMSINSEHSKIAEKIFGTTEFDKKNIASLFNMDEATREAFAHWLSLAFQRSTSLAVWEETLRLNPIKELAVERESKIFLKVHYQPVCENGVLSRVMVIGSDITQQKMAQQYEHLASLLRATLESTVDGILVADLAGHITSCNKKFGELWQIPAHLVDIKNESRLLSFMVGQLADPEKFSARVKEIYSQPQRESFDIIEFRDGRVFERNSKPQWIDDTIVGRVWCFLDVSERKKTEAMLVNAQKLDSLGVLAGGIAHDFNNLLTGIFGYIELARLVSRDTTTSEYLNATIDTLGRAKALTMQLLTFAKGGSPVQNIMPIIPIVRQAAQFALSGSNILCRFDLSDTLWPCNIDKNQISQVIDNIVINAHQAMPDGGVIEIAAKNVSIGKKGFHPQTQSDYVKVSIKDSGPGIPPDVMPRIFDPFYTTKPKGHGLGLAMCYSIINRHGGYIDVESEQGNGTAFHLYLPASREAVFSGAPPNEMHTGSGTIIVVDDEAVVRHTLGRMLESMGYSVVCKNDGRAAIDFYVDETKAGHTFAAMFFDLTIPGGMGGIAAVSEIRKLNGTIAVFVASGYADDSAMKNPGEYGFTASVSKPFTIVELSQMLNANLVK
jgi:signal transduction histidine kinase/ligand-binding sensor domain-containing protein/CheY-like chemotaxis protein